jgi:uncharacterized protein YecE (DUF72 family)
MTKAHEILIGTAGWSIPAAVAESFHGSGSHLERYARRFPAVEINSSFHRPHRRTTYERWAGAVPPGFRFSLKLPKAITHERRLVDSADLLGRFAGEAAGLGDKLAVVLVQLPPSLQLDLAAADTFFATLRRYVTADIACEPRHATWFTEEAHALLVEHRVARVAADPVLVPAGDRPGGWPGLRYHRLHGAPRVYHSPYDDQQLQTLAQSLRHDGDSPSHRWCMFDNTASGAAAANALKLQALL